MANGVLGEAFEEGADDMSEAAGQATEAMGTWFERSAQNADATAEAHVDNDVAGAAEFAPKPSDPVPQVGGGRVGAVLGGDGESDAGDVSAPALRRPWPTDPRTGNPLTDRDLEFLGLTRAQVEDWQAGKAPLGMSPADYREWHSSLRDALSADGIDPDAPDVRLLGSSARGFSGPHKSLPDEAQITADFPPDVAATAIERRAGWLGDDPGRLTSRPFDAMSKLGLDEPSDYDTNVSSDAMVAKARQVWEDQGSPGSFLSGDHEYVGKRFAKEAFPHVTAWADAWSERLGREVSWAVFPSAGPKDVSASGHFVHFQDDDWIVQRPEAS